tara:strand:+ start:855 stop:1469 length:615 start_codon:yes stop_codon:yes gene_type:complete
MSTFKDYLTESTKSYDYKIKIAGASKDIDKNALETALQKFDLSKMSAGKTTPIQSLPLDFPALSNEQVTIFDVTTNYPEAPRVMHEYLADLLKIPMSHMVVRKPGEPTEEYQDAMGAEKTSEFASKLQDVEMKDSPKVNKDEHTGDKYNMSLMRELLKTRSENMVHAEEDSANKDDKKLQDREDKPAPSPFTKPTNPHPDPKRK